ncbi:MAG TPA: hypothetical protein VHR66_03245 [Gemmataceae bacterium]|jgi:hypothetical protein|nr:hypothetical protein [Gemmataceae bacterium]
MRRVFQVFAIGVAVLTGCTTAPKVADAPTAARAAAPEATVVANQYDRDGKLNAFITNQGLPTTPAKSGEPARIAVAWNNKVIYAPDPTHGGDLVPGLLGKMWVFGPEEGVPLVIDGELIVGVWDLGPKAKGGQPALQEVWHIDNEAAKKFRKKDFMGGEAYTVFLPWSQYNVDIKQVNVIARFNAAGGRSLVSTPETLTIDHSATLQRAQDKLNGYVVNPQAKLDIGPGVQSPSIATK